MTDKEYAEIERGRPVVLVCLRPDAGGNLFRDAVVLGSEVKGIRDGHPVCQMTFGTVEMTVMLSRDGSCSVEDGFSALWKTIYPVKWCLNEDEVPGIMDGIVAGGGPDRLAPGVVEECGLGSPHFIRRELGRDPGLARLFARVSREVRKEDRK